MDLQDLKQQKLSQAEEEYNFLNPSSQRAIDEAADNDLDVVFPEADELQLDFDTEEQYQYFLKVQDVMKKYISEPRSIEWHASRSGLPKRHVTVKLERDIDDKERVLLQVLFGSDPMRELLSYVQVLIGDPHPILFLEERQKALPPAPEPAGLLTA